MKHLYIFDMGGVVSENTNVLPDIAAHLGISLEDLHVWTHEFGRDLMEGTLLVEDFWQIFSARSGIHVAEDLFSKFFSPRLNNDMIALITTLKQQHRVVCGTNTIAAHYAHHLEYGEYDVFDAVYASHLLGIAKPSPHFYHQILTEEQVPASQAIFVDDTPKNVEAARQVGIHAIHFTSYAAFIMELREI